MRNTIVNPESKMESAISFGVFLRFATSTSEIILSINVSPGFEVILITIFMNTADVVLQVKTKD